MRTLFSLLLFCFASLGLVDGIVHEEEASAQNLSLRPTLSDTSLLISEARAQKLSELLADKLIAESLAFDTMVEKWEQQLEEKNNNREHDCGNFR